MVTASKGKAAAKAKPGTKGVRGDRPVLYPQRKKSEPYSLITVEYAKELLGWTEETEDNKFGADFLLEAGGKKIRCLNNITNRPLYTGNVETLKRDILNKHWRYNSEPIIIGVTGLVLNGQHSLIALILAELERTGPDKYHWESVWDGPCTLDKDITFGVDEDDATVNTMDTCKPRSLTDVLYRSAYFKDLGEGERKAVARACSFAIQLLWLRTGGGSGGFVGKDKGKHTHAEYVDFLERHPKLMDCVKHVYQENKNNAIAKHITVGYASALMYLMAASDTDGEEYHTSELKNETHVNFDKWEQARAFWVKLASGSPDFADLRYVLGGLVDPTTGTPNDLPAVIAVLANAWDQFRDGYTPDKEYCSLKLSEPDEHTGIRTVIEWPDFGGIDKGQEVEVKRKTDDEPDGSAGDEDEADEGKVKVNRTPEAGAIHKQLKALKDSHPGRVLMIRNPEAWVVWEDDADAVAEVAGKKIIEKAGLRTTHFKPEEMAGIADKLVASGRTPALCYPGGDGMTVQDYVPTGPAPAPAKVKPGAKPKSESEAPKAKVKPGQKK